MLALYLFCLVVGGGLLLFSAVTALGDGEADAHDDAGHDLHAGADVPFREFFSLRALLYFAAGFGSTGTLLTTVAAAPPAAALTWATGTGVIAATAAGAVYAWLRRSESGLVPLGTDHLVGLPARVVLPVEPGHRGKVLAVHDGRELELLARLFADEDGACPRGSQVVIVEIDGDTALVTPIPHLPSDAE